MTELGHWSHGNLENASLCPACGSDKRNPLAYERRDNYQSMPERWRMVRCTTCESLWLDPRPDAVSLPRAYDGYFTHNVAASRNMAAEGRHRRIWRLINGYLNKRFGLHQQPADQLGYYVLSLFEPVRLRLDRYCRHLTRKRFAQPGRLLDVGCGNGRFLLRAIEMGWSVRGCEVDPGAVSACRAVDLDVVGGDIFDRSLDHDVFDVVTMDNVLEHMIGQQGVVSRAFTLLQPGGWLWMALPNPDASGLRAFGSAWSALHPPCHLCIPSQRIIATWLNHAGFGDVRFVRPGIHAGSTWNWSADLARREGIPISGPFSRKLGKVFADFCATFSPKRVEETIVLAQKPQ